MSNKNKNMKDVAQRLIENWFQDLNQRALADQQRCALPVIDRDLAWITTWDRWKSEDTTVEPLKNLLAVLQELRIPSVAVDSQTVEQRMTYIGNRLAAYDPDMLSKESKQLHTEASRQLMELYERRSGNMEVERQEGTTHFFLDAGGDQKSKKDQKPVGENAAQKARLELSRSQLEAVACPRSIFIQGRSGTGKTLVLVRRMLRRKLNTTQVFVTKSSLLRHDVVEMLRSEAKVKVAEPVWPVPGNSIMCTTWEELADLVLGTTRARAAINYDVFLRSYWPDLQTDADGLEPLLVWTEFNTRLRPFGPCMMVGLNFEEYTAEDVSAIGIRLSRKNLQVIHKMFTKYKSLKRQSCQFDDVDVAGLMLKALDSANKFAAHIDALSVDEVQDFSPAELTLLISLCKDPNGLTMAGDTCQTINPGSSFSFKHLVEAFRTHGGATSRSMQAMHQQALAKMQHEKSKLGRLKRAKWEHHQSVAKDAAAALTNAQQAWTSSALECQIHTLNYNYRCMKGVADLASSVTRLLLEHFPHSADQVEEHALLQGSKIPVYVSLPGEDPGTCIMGSGSWRLPKTYPFRAVILVSSDAKRKQLRQEGVLATILTVAEAKGLEFDIVILYGLLSDSEDGRFWNIADLDSQESQVTLMAARPNTFLSTEDHTLLCQLVQAVPVLKSLYVAISRARVGCAILECDLPSSWEREGLQAEPLVRLWQNAGLVECWEGVRRYKQEAGSQCQQSTALPLGHTNDGMPSLEFLLCQRFAQMLEIRRKSWEQNAALSSWQEQEPDEDMAVVISSLQQRGLQLLRHALDDPRERAQVFDEARRALVQCRKLVDVRLALQICDNGSRMMPLHRAQSLPPATDLESWQHLLAAWIQESMRAPSPRGYSAFRRLQRFDIIMLVFSFLIEEEKAQEMMHVVCSIINRIQEHAELYQQLTSQLVMCQAWFLRHSSKNEAELQDPVDIEDIVRAALLDGSPEALSNDNNCDAWGDNFEDSKTLQVIVAKDTDPTQHALSVLLARPEKSSTAGRAFLAVSRPVFAAQAFEEAHQAVARELDILTREKIRTCARVGAQAMQKVCRQDAFLSMHLGSKASVSSRLAAHCWLLVAAGTGCEMVSRMEALQRAEADLSLAGESLMAALCAVQSRRFLAAFTYLADHFEMDLATSHVGLVSLTCRQAMLMAQTDLIGASLLAQLCISPSFAAASRSCLVLCFSFEHISEPWHETARVLTHWTSFFKKRLELEGWHPLLRFLGLS